VNDNGIGYLLKGIGDALKHCMDQRLKGSNTTFSQARILDFLSSCQNQSASQKQIEDCFQITHPTVIGLVRRLETKGLVRTSHSSTDGRVRIVELTDTGRDHVEICRLDREEHEGLILKGFNDEEALQLSQLLQRVYENLR
jgi:MarR family transcriptional repressor of mepA